MIPFCRFYGINYDMATWTPREIERGVGTLESQQYLNLESTRLWDPNWDEWTRNAIQVLGERWVCFFSLSKLSSGTYICLICASSIQLYYRSLTHNFSSSQLRPHPRSSQRWSHCRKHLVRRCSLWHICKKVNRIDGITCRYSNSSLR
jgi:hypothetical protein